MISSPAFEKNKAMRVLSQIQGNIGGDLRISQHGVPHLVLGGKGGLSISYFGRTRILRIFLNYMSFAEPAPKFSFSNWMDAKSFLKTRPELGTLA